MTYDYRYRLVSYDICNEQAWTYQHIVGSNTPLTDDEVFTKAIGLGEDVIGPDTYSGYTPTDEDLVGTDYDDGGEPSWHVESLN